MKIEEKNTEFTIDVLRLATHKYKFKPDEIILAIISLISIFDKDSKLSNSLRDRLNEDNS